MLGAFTSMFWGGEPLGSETTTAIDTIDREDEAGASGSKPGDGAAVDADLNDVAEKTEEKGADVKKKAEEGSKKKPWTNRPVNEKCFPSPRRSFAPN